jgi:hypothetical protein
VKYLFGIEKESHPPQAVPSWYGWQKAYANLRLPARMFSPALVDRAREDYVAPLIARYHENVAYWNIRKLDDDENLNGIRNLLGMNPINMKSSMGFPANGTKMEYAYRDDEGKLFMVDEFYEIVEYVDDQYRSGRRVYPTIKACKKDEVLMKEGKCRIFYSNPMYFTFLLRRYFLSMIRFLMLNPLLCECAVGINAIGPEWEELVEYAKSKDSDRAVAGDYGKYDQKMPSQMIFAAISIFIELAQEAGFHREDLLAMQTMAYDLVYARVAFDGDLLEFVSGGHISGNSLTVMVNSIVGSLQWRCAFYHLYPEAADFRQHVALVTYGDDNIGSVDPLYSNFNIVTISKFLEEHGQEYTMPNKEDELQPTIAWEEVEFLKRKTVYHPKLGKGVGALSLESICKRLMAYINSNNEISEFERMVENADSSLLDFFLHGEAEYEKFKDLLRELVGDRVWNCMHFSSRSYDDWVLWWREQYLGESVQPEFDEETQIVLAPQCSWGTTEKLKKQDAYWIPSILSLGRDRLIGLRVESPNFRYWCLPMSCSLNCPQRDANIMLSAYPTWCIGNCLMIRKECEDHNAEVKLQEQNEKSLEEQSGYVPISRGVEHDLRRAFELLDRVLRNLPRMMNDDLCINRANMLLRHANDLIVFSQELLEDPMQALEEQSGPIENVESHKGHNVETEWNVAFHDADGGYTLNMEVPDDDVRKTRLDVATNYKDDLERPALIADFKWQYGNGSQGAKFSVWELLRTQPFIRDRLRNHKLFRGDLVLKSVINGNAFYYGRAQLCYRYFPFLDAYGMPTIGRGRSCIISQLPRMLINPTNSSGGEMVIPFHHFQDFIDLSTDSFEDMGELEFDVLAALQHLSGTAPDLTIKIYAYFKNVETFGLTAIDYSSDPLTLVSQMGEIDEANSKGVISGPASQVASIARVLRQIPFLKPYAMATEIAATGVGKVAKIFGYSRPRITAEGMRYMPDGFGASALTDVPSAVHSLAVHEKNELSVDPRIANDKPYDSLAITSIASRDSFWGSFDWDESMLTGQRLAQFKVNPLYIVRRDDDPTGMAFTALAAAAFPFDYWTGSIIFRFSVACSGLHKGRLRIVYDPTGGTDMSIQDMQKNTMKIVDIADEPDFSVQVGVHQSTTFLETSKDYFDPNPASVWGTDMWTTGNTAFAQRPLTTSENGTIMIFVETPLSSPDLATSTNVEIVSHVCGGEDFEVASPNDHIAALAPYKENSAIPPLPPQSGDVESDKGASAALKDGAPMQGPTMMLTGMKCSENMNKVYMGERITSLRPLTKRYAFHRLAQLLSGNATDSATFVFGVRLPYCGLMPGEVDRVDNAAPIQYTFAGLTMAQYVSLMHAGTRGAMRWKAIYSSGFNDDEAVIYGKRVHIRPGEEYSFPFLTQNMSLSPNRDNYFLFNDGTAGPTILGGNGGMAVSPERVNPCVSLEVPYYSQSRFDLTKSNRNIRGLTGCRQAVEFATFGRQRDTRGSFACFLAAGDDFQVYHFTGLPYMRVVERT